MAFLSVELRWFQGWPGQCFLLLMYITLYSLWLLILEANLNYTLMRSSFAKLDLLECDMV